jgi:hypothetical protein
MNDAVLNANTPRGYFQRAQPLFEANDDLDPRRDPKSSGCRAPIGAFGISLRRALGKPDSGTAVSAGGRIRGIRREGEAAAKELAVCLKVRMQKNVATAANGRNSDQRKSRTCQRVLRLRSSGTVKSISLSRLAVAWSTGIGKRYPACSVSRDIVRVPSAESIEHTLFCTVLPRTSGYRTRFRWKN